MEVKSSSGIEGESDKPLKKGMVLPFQPLSLAFNHINYYVDMPAVSYQIRKIPLVLMHYVYVISFLFIF